MKQPKEWGYYGALVWGDTLGKTMGNGGKTMGQPWENDDLYWTWPIQFVDLPIKDGDFP